MNVLNLSASQLLAINDPERLFGKPERIADLYKALAMKWHPDHGGDEGIFKHLNALHVEAKKILETGSWHVPGELTFTSNGKTFALHYFKSFDFELGKVFLSETRITYVIRKEFADLVANAIKVIKKFEFPDSKTKEVMTRYLPVVKGEYETSTDVIVMIDKPADLIRLRDLYDHLGHKIDSKHVAWIVSRMLHHASYFEWAKLTHNDFSMDSLFICPEHHTICVLGGWWYAAPFDSKLTALSQRTINNAPTEVIRNKKASYKTDLELVRLTAREMLGNANGIHLVNDTSIPNPMINWLRLSSNGSAVQDYDEWRERILPDSFGPRKFVKMRVFANDVYQQN